MKAIRVHQFGEPEVLKLEEVPDPKPGAGQVVVKIEAVGINPVETYIRAGRYGPKQFPYTPGNDGAGTIEAAGTGVQWKKGDRVYVAGSTTGTYAQLALCDAKKVHRLPENSSFEEGAALGVPAATAWRALFQRGGAQRGETLLIHGASGGVGTMAVQLARDAGLTIIGTAGSEKKAGNWCEDWGRGTSSITARPDYLKEIMAITENRGVNLILEMLANVNLAKDLSLLAKFGRVVVIGSRGTIEIDPRDTMSRDADIRGMTLFNVNDQDYEAIHSGIVAELEEGRLKPIIEMKLPLAEAARAHRVVMEGESHGKIVLVP